jgi:glycosyltransferase involved in cell wall biosynthesis
MSKRSIPRLCILNIDGYPLYNPRCRSPFGGAEVQCFLLAQGLAETGHFDVHVIVADHGQPSLEHREGVKVHPHSAYRFAVRVDDTLKTSLRWWTRRVTRALIFRLHLMPTEYISNYPINLSKTAIYDDVNADVYLARWNTRRAADLAFYCNQRRKPFVFLAALDSDYSEDCRNHPELEYVIEHARLHIAQTRYQSDLLRANYGRSSIVLRNMIDTERAFPRDTAPDMILWVGKANHVKRPEIMIDLAREFPEYCFVLILNRGDDRYFQQIQQMASVLQNVTLIEHVPYTQIERYFATAKLFVSTSNLEGLPNTFLQAAKYGVPIVSYEVDPGGIISKHRCGLFCDGEFERLKEKVRSLMEVPEFYRELSDNGIEYVRTYHDKDELIGAYEQAIVSVLRDQMDC